MLKNKITRKEFLKTGFLTIIAILAMPFLKILDKGSNTAHKDARYYKNLAG